MKTTIRMLVAGMILALAPLAAQAQEAGRSKEEEAAWKEYQQMVREYRQVSRELERATGRITAKSKAQSAKPDDYNTLVSLQSRKDLLYSRITLTSLRYGWEIPEEATGETTSAPTVDPAGVFAGGKAMVVERLQADAKKAVSEVVARCIPGTCSCDLSGTEDPCPTCEIIRAE